MKRLIYIAVLAVLSTGAAHAQSSINPITTAAPFLTIAPDARSSAMGNTGIATLPDAASQYWNPAKYVFMPERGGVALNYAPMAKAVASNSYDLYLSGFFRIDTLQSVSASISYFSYGNDITYKDNNNQTIGTHKPYEMAFDAAYSRRLTPYLSAGIAFRYIRSEIVKNFGTENTLDVKAGQAFAADLALYYLRPVSIIGQPFRLGVGLDFSNIGTKMPSTTDGQSDFLPMNMRLGGMLSYDFSKDHRLSLALDFNKLLVPTPPVYDADGNIIDGKDPDRSVVSAIFTSFADAPGGFSEEVKEITTSVGLEYTYANLASLRLGYYEQSQEKGASSFFGIGAGVIYKMLNFDVAYLVPTSSLPVFGNTFKLSLGVVF